MIIIVLLLAGGGVFWWWQNQEDIRELNKNLPEGVRVAKNLKGEYWVVNRIDGYEFRVPGEWKGIEEIEYVAERIEEGYTGVSIELTGKEGMGRSVGVDCFKGEGDLNLENWAKKFFDIFGLTGKFIPEKIGEVNIVKTQENVHLGGEYVYFFKKDFAIYAITCGSEEYISEIITSGKW